jgi:hypothetical protein
MESKSLIKYKIVVPAEKTRRLTKEELGEEAFQGYCEDRGDEDDDNCDGYYKWCGFCGSVKNTVQSFWEDSNTWFYSFCKDTECDRMYHAHASNHRNPCTDLTYGLPFLCVKQRNENRDFVVPVIEAQRKDLTCAYCGECNSKVITNTCMLKYRQYLYEYEHHTFCKNDTCCKLYKEYVDHRRSEVVPHVFKSECQCLK